MFAEPGGSLGSCAELPSREEIVQTALSVPRDSSSEAQSSASQATAVIADIASASGWLTQYASLSDAGHGQSSGLFHPGSGCSPMT